MYISHVWRLQVDATQNFEKIVRRPKLTQPVVQRIEKKLRRDREVELSKVPDAICRVVYENIDRKSGVWKTGSRDALIEQLLEKGCLNKPLFKQTDHVWIVSNFLDELTDHRRVYFADSDGAVELSGKESHRQHKYAKAHKKTLRQRSDNRSQRRLEERMQLETP